MDLHFLDPGLDYSIEGLLAFQQENQTEWWREALFLFYPQVDRARFDAMHQNERRAYLRETKSRRRRRAISRTGKSIARRSRRRFRMRLESTRAPR